MPVIKIGTHNEVIIPKDIREELGVKPGDLVQATFQPVPDLPYADEPLGAKDKAGLREAQDDVKAGRTYGPFDNVKDAIRHLKTKPPESSANQS